jgi:hypothetical protein
MPAVCADISSTGISTALFFGIAGLLVWAIAWFLSIRQAASRR